MKRFENRQHLPAAAVGVTFFCILLPLDWVWLPSLIAIKIAVNAVSVLVYAGVLDAFWNGKAQPVEHGGLLFVVGLMTIPQVLLLAVFYYSGLLCIAVSVLLAAALLVDWLNPWRRRKE